MSLMPTMYDPDPDSTGLAPPQAIDVRNRPDVIAIQKRAAMQKAAQDAQVDQQGADLAANGGLVPHPANEVSLAPDQQQLYDAIKSPDAATIANSSVNPKSMVSISNQLANPKLATPITRDSTDAELKNFGEEKHHGLHKFGDIMAGIGLGAGTFNPFAGMGMYRMLADAPANRAASRQAAQREGLQGDYARAKDTRTADLADRREVNTEQTHRDTVANQQQRERELNTYREGELAARERTAKDAEARDKANQDAKNNKAPSEMELLQTINDPKASPEDKATAQAMLTSQENHHKRMQRDPKAAADVGDTQLTVGEQRMLRQKLGNQDVMERALTNKYATHVDRGDEDSPEAQNVKKQLDQMAAKRQAAVDEIMAARKNSRIPSRQKTAPPPKDTATADTPPLTLFKGEGSRVRDKQTNVVWQLKNGVPSKVTQQQGQ